VHWEKYKDFENAKFRRLVGVKRATFDKMVEVLLANPKRSTHPIHGAIRGPKPKLVIEDQLLMMLMYYREYRTFFHTGASFGLSEAMCWRVVRDLEERLIKSGQFSLPRRQALATDAELEIVVVDVSEHPIERPKKTTRPLLR
jgi:hypothetical protein